MSKRIRIEKKTAVSVRIERGGAFRVVNTEGGQVVDTWAFNAVDVDEYLSMEHSRSANYRLNFRPGDVLVSNAFRPMLTLVEDSSPGFHDTLHAACSAASYAFFGSPVRHPNCQDNLRQQMARRGANIGHVPCPWNLFEHTRVDPELNLSDETSRAAAGDYIELRAEMDLILVCSACPSEVGAISGLGTRGAALEILD